MVEAAAFLSEPTQPARAPSRRPQAQDDGFARTLEQETERAEQSPASQDVDRAAAPESAPSTESARDDAPTTEQSEPDGNATPATTAETGTSEDETSLDGAPAPDGEAIAAASLPVAAQSSAASNGTPTAPQAGVAQAGVAQPVATRPDAIKTGALSGEVQGALNQTTDGAAKPDAQGAGIEAIANDGAKSGEKAGAGVQIAELAASDTERLAASETAPRLANAPARGPETAPSLVATGDAVRDGAALTARTPDVDGFSRLIARRAGAGETRFEMQLDPPELGRVDVRLTVGENGKAQAHLAFDRNDAMDHFQRDFRALQKALSDAGFELSEGDIEFSLRDDAQFADSEFAGGDQDADGSNTDGAAEPDASAAAPIRSPYPLPQTALSGLDITV